MTIARSLRWMFLWLPLGCAGHVVTVAADGGADVSLDAMPEADTGGLPTCRVIDDCPGRFQACLHGVCCGGTWTDGVGCNCNGGPSCDLLHVCCRPGCAYHPEGGCVPPGSDTKFGTDVCGC